MDPKAPMTKLLEKVVREGVESNFAGKTADVYTSEIAEVVKRRLGPLLEAGQVLEKKLEDCQGSFACRDALEALSAYRAALKAALEE